jgi:hypothetical protein
VSEPLERQLTKEESEIAVESQSELRKIAPPDSPGFEVDKIAKPEVGTGGGSLPSGGKLNGSAAGGVSAAQEAGDDHEEEHRLCRGEAEFGSVISMSKDHQR